MREPIRILLLGATLASLAPAVHAQSARAPAANAQVQAQMQQLASERTRLMSENARLQSELDAVRKERDELKKKSGGSDGRLQASAAAAARAGARAETLQGELDREKARTAEVVAKFRELANSLREVETDRTTTKAALAQRDIDLKQCAARNVALYDLNGEILTKLEGRGSFSPASALEPFTKLKRIELENLIDGYQSRADEQRPPTAAR